MEVINVLAPWHLRDLQMEEAGLTELNWLDEWTTDQKVRAEYEDLVDLIEDLHRLHTPL